MNMLRLFQKNEIPVLAAIKLKAIATSMQYKKFVRTQEAEEEYLRETAKRCTVLVAVKNAKPVGFIAFSKDFIEQIYIDPEYQNRGIGAQLISSAQSVSSKLRLSVDNQNIRAARLYERHGFKFEKRVENTTSSEYIWSKT